MLTSCMRCIDGLNFGSGHQGTEHEFHHRQSAILLNSSMKFELHVPAFCARVLHMLLDLHLPGSKFSNSVQKPRLMHMVAVGLLYACFAMQELLLGHNLNTRPDSELCFDMGKQVSAVSFDTILTRYGRYSLA